MTPALSIQNLTKYYRNFKALDGVSFEVAPGEFFGFLGPNGAGKTTTINAVTGLANYQSGRVRVFGHDVTSDYRRSRAEIGLVPQEFNFDPFLSAEQILEFEGGYFGIPHRETKKRASELLEVFGLSEKRKDGYKRLSGGMKRRLLIARALMHNPRILILDEPTAGVDLELRHQLWDFLRRLNREGKTLFLTTHYIEEAEKLCTRVGVIHQGRMVGLDSTAKLIREISADRIVFYLKKEMTFLPEAAAGLGLRLEESGRRISFEEKAGLVPRVLKTLQALDQEVEKIDVEHPTLEDAFLKLTGKNESYIRPLMPSHLEMPEEK